MGIKGKKLLVLGAADSLVGVTITRRYATELDIVRSAQAMGLYVVVTDSQSNWDLAPAKKVANEGWNISWSDIDALAKKCIEEKIDGVIAGFSEKRVSNAAKLCAALGKPFYTDGANLETIFNKALFMQACEKAHVDTPHQYANMQDVKYPVVVKPADNAGSRGVVICHNKQELDIGFQDALAYSNLQSVLVEEYVDGIQTHIYFYVEEGEPHLILTNDLLSYEKKKEEITEYYCLAYPSRYQSRILDSQCQRAFETLIRNLNIKNGFIGFQCLTTSDRIVVHDPTFRIDGTDMHSVLKSETGMSDIEMLIYYSLNKSFPNSERIKRLAERKASERYIYRTFFIRLCPGVIASLKGVTELKQIEGVLDVVMLRQVGDEVFHNDIHSSLLCLIKLSVGDKAELKQKLGEVFDSLEVNDAFGNDMVIRSDMSVFF